MSDLDVFLQSLTAPGIGTVRIPVNTARDWLVSNGENIASLRKKASDHGRTCEFVMHEQSNFLELKRILACQDMEYPQTLATRTAPSQKEHGLSSL